MNVSSLVKNKITGVNSTSSIITLLPKSKSITECVGKYIRQLTDHLEQNGHGTLTINEIKRSYEYNIPKALESIISKYIQNVESIYLCGKYFEEFEKLFPHTHDYYTEKYIVASSIKFNHLPVQIKIHLDRLNIYMMKNYIGSIWFNNNNYIFHTYPSINVFIQTYIRKMEKEYSATSALSIKYVLPIQSEFSYVEKRELIEQPKDTGKHNKYSYHKPEQPSSPQKSLDIQLRIDRLSPVISATHTNNSILSTRYYETNIGNCFKRQNGFDDTPCKKKPKFEPDTDYIPL
jgi:hypothetical protein